MTERENLIAQARDMGDKRRKMWPTPPDMARMIRRLLDALDAAEQDARKSREVGERILADATVLRRERDEALAAVERAKALIGDVTEQWKPMAVLDALDSVPADVLRERDAEKWDEGWGTGSRDVLMRSRLTPTKNPYRETKEQD